MSRLILVKGNLFDANKGKIIPDQTVVINNRMIEWVGNYAEFDAESGDKVLDLDGKYVLPGLFDCHVHIEFNFSAMASFERFQFRHKESYIPLLGLKHAQEYLKHGVTTIRDCGSWTETGSSSIKMAIENGLYAGPRLINAQQPMAQYGNQEQFGPDIWRDVIKDYEVMSGPDGVMHGVRDRKRAGSDFIKTMTTGGVLHGRGSKLERYLWTDEELEAMVREAERLGMYVAAHAHTEPGIENAVRAGVRSIEHGSLLNENTMDLMIQKGTYLVPTHSPGHYINPNNPEVAGQFPLEILEKAAMITKKIKEQHKIAFEKGVTIALGTDGPVGGEHSHTGLELELMVKDCGMTNAQALQAGTINAARALDIDKEVGSVEVGKIADIVVVSQNPLENISLFRDSANVDHVLRNGSIVSQNGELCRKLS